MNFKIKYIVSFILCYIGVISFAHASASLPNNTMRPSQVPENYVVTPFGYFHPSCVNKINNDEVVAPGLSIEKNGKEVRRLEKCLFSSFSKKGQERHVDSTASIHDGWQISSSYYLDGDLGYLTAVWTVPSDPVINQGQTLYFFPGVEQNPVISILQPVLGWNQLGRPGWTLASWNCCERGTVTHSEPVKTSAGETNEGKIYYDDNLNGYYIQSFVNPFTSSKVMTQLGTRHYNRPVNWVLGGVMESYHVASCDALPADGAFIFGTVSVYDRKDNLVTKNFKTHLNHGDNCNYKASVSSSKFPDIKFTFSNDK